jgi:hypothetical protein
MTAIAMSWDSFLANGQMNVIIPAKAVEGAIMFIAPVRVSALNLNPKLFRHTEFISQYASQQACHRRRCIGNREDIE